MSKKKIAIITLSVVYVAAMGALLWNYNIEGPKRASSAFLSSIITKGDATAAYKQTSSTYQHNVSLAEFTQFFQGLMSSKVKYSVKDEKVTAGNAVTAGSIFDYQGANYVYIFHLERQGGTWLIDSTYNTKQ
ncbi:MAG TPA: hypothetical protein VFN56_01315 [Candidatus Saccharimonadales bacterium]|nr:hypothetical protein [Candidatus Saccharimonadales bacterium]